MGDFVRVATVGELSDPGSTVVEVDGDLIALFHVEGVYYALDDVCTHDGGPLASGELTGHKVACPRHGAKFDIRTGAALSMPAVRATRAHDVKVENGGVWVRLRSGHGVDGPVDEAPRRGRYGYSPLLVSCWSFLVYGRPMALVQWWNSQHRYFGFSCFW